MFKKRAANLLIALSIVSMALLSIGTMIFAQPITDNPANNRATALDWYFAHDHSNLDGDNNAVSSEPSEVDGGWAPLDWYLAHEHAILDGDNNVLAR